MLTRILSIIVILVVLSVAVSASFVHTQEKLPELGVITPFNLVDKDNKPFSSDILKGEVSLVNFFFTSCPSICPALMGKIAQIEYKNPDIKLISISIDPETDTPQKISEYAKKFPVKDNQWRLLTGDKKEIDRIAQEIVKVGAPLKVEDHSTRFILIDKKGHIRGFYQGMDPDVVELINRDLKNL